MDATLYSLAPSHPSRSAHLMLDHKGIEHRVVTLPAGSQPLALRALGFRGGTVPALKIDGRRVQTSREISRALDEMQPDPPLFPADPERRAAVEEAERWGDEVYQPVPRRMFRWALTHDGNLRRHLIEQDRMPAPGLVSPAMRPVAAFFARAAGADEQRVRDDLAELPAHLDHVDGLISGGTLGGEVPNAADFQIATTTRVLLNFPQLRPLIEPRPAGEHAMRIAPRFGREIPIRLPEDAIPATP